MWVITYEWSKDNKPFVAAPTVITMDDPIKLIRDLNAKQCIVRILNSVFIPYRDLPDDLRITISA